MSRDVQSDHLHHWPAIAAHFGIKPDAARHLAKTQELPMFRIGKTVCASRAALDKWLTARAGRSSGVAA